MVEGIKKRPKLRTYAHFKTEHDIESYVKFNLEENQHLMLAQLRSGILPLHIETGRFSNKTLEDRLCTFCNSGEIENDTHFLFHCSI